MQKIAKIFVRNFIYVWFARPFFWIMLFISYLLIIKTEFLQNFARSNILLLKHILYCEKMVTDKSFKVMPIVS